MLQEVSECRELAMRAQSMMLMPAVRATRTGSPTSMAGGWRSGFGDERLRLWGIKIVADGGAEAVALIDPYLNRPEYRGSLIWSAPMRLPQSRGTLK